MKTGGSGGANTNASGKPFEECFRPTGTRVIGGKVFEYIDQDTFVEHMKELKDPQWEHKKKPDGAFVSEDKKTVFIIECKHQIVSGSVDEKLRAGPCLLTEYKQLYPTVDNIYMMFIVGIPVFFAKQIGSAWKIHIQKNVNKWTIYPAHYGVDEESIFEWMTAQVLQSS